jgi:hypothetical protein
VVAVKPKEGKESKDGKETTKELTKEIRVEKISDTQTQRGYRHYFRHSDSCSPPATDGIGQAVHSSGRAARAGR